MREIAREAANFVVALTISITTTSIIGLIALGCFALFANDQEIAFYINFLVKTLAISCPISLLANAIRKKLTPHTRTPHEQRNSSAALMKCFSCQYYSRSGYLRCAVNPMGNSHECSDYRKANLSEQERLHGED